MKKVTFGLVSLFLPLSGAFVLGYFLKTNWVRPFYLPPGALGPWGIFFAFFAFYVLMSLCAFFALKTPNYERGMFFYSLELLVSVLFGAFFSLGEYAFGGLFRCFAHFGDFAVSLSFLADVFDLY